MKYLLVLFVVLTVGCSSSPTTKSILVHETKNQTDYKRDSIDCVSLADQRYGISPPNEQLAYSPLTNKSPGGGTGGAIVYGLQAADEDAKWKKSRDTFLVSCMHRYGWTIKEVAR